jgi:signal transduction histidine kinase/ligand-binding sensor domain-containing protein
MPGLTQPSLSIRWIGILLLSANAAFAAPQWEDLPVKSLPVTENPNLRFDHLLLSAGPLHRRITGIGQDDFGFIWIGTDDGLKRWDGYRIRDFRHDSKNPNSLPDNYVIALSKDRSGKLWVASGRNLDVYDPRTDRFAPFRDGKARLTARVGEIRQDGTGAIWLASDQGLYEANADGHITFHYQHDAKNGASLSSDRVWSALESRDGTFWVATAAGIDSIDRKSRKVARRIAFDLSHSVGSTLVEDHAGVIWLAYHGSHGPGLTSLDRNANRLTHYRLFPGEGSAISPGAAALCEDADGNLWVGSNAGGLIMFNSDRTRLVRYHNRAEDPTSLASDEVTQLLLDREGGIWVGTKAGGINRATRNPLPFRRYVNEPGNPNSLDRDSVDSIFRDSRGFLWIGCTRSLARVDPKTGKFTFFRTHGGAKPGEMSGVWARAIAEDPSGDLWFAIQGYGLNRLNPRTGRVNVYRHDKTNPSSLSSDDVQSLHFDRSGTLWVGTTDGLNAFDPKTGSLRVYPPPVKPSSFRWISEDPRGSLWLSTGWNGVVRFDPQSGKFTVYRHSEAGGSLSSDAVNAVYADVSGTVWVGTQAGLNRLDPATGVFTAYDPSESGISIGSILEDSRGNLWLGTADGLVRFDPRTRAFRHYYTSDGLSANELEFFGAWNSPEGEMYFGTSNGLTVFDPGQIPDASYVPPVRLTDIQIFGKPAAIGPKAPLQESIAAARSLLLTHAQNVFSLEFAALSYANPERNRYRYRLEPVEKEWNQADSSRRSVTYPALPSGHYVFRVQGSDSHGIWNETGASLAISALPPWWDSWPFKTALLAALLLCLWTFLQLRLRQQEREFNLSLEARVDERLRVARDLHDTMLQTFQSALIQMQAAFNQLSRRPEIASETLKRAIAISEMAIAEGREAIQNMRSSTVDTNNLARALRAEGDRMAAQGSATFAVKVQGSSRDVHPILRDDVYRIAIEAMRNAFKHADAQAIEVEIAYEDSFRVRVRDDGKGLDAETLNVGRPGHYGIPGMRERAQRIGGKLDVRSGPGAGTEIQLTIPGRIAFGRSAAASLLRRLSRKSKSHVAAKS